MTSKLHSMGWKPDIPDYRDYYLYIKIADITDIPSCVDLAHLMPPIQDQGNLGSCTANAVAAAHEYQQLEQRKEGFIPSRLFIYYNSRLIEGTVKYDSGATLRDAIKSVARYGVCPEFMWDYDIKKYSTAPPRNLYSEGRKHQAILYKRIRRDMNTIRMCLSSRCPFVLGFTVYNSFMGEDVASTGIMTMPHGDDYVVGGHAVLCVGYDDKENKFKCRNSWGVEWGYHGYFYMPYEYLMNENLSDDFWTIELVE